MKEYFEKSIETLYFGTIVERYLVNEHWMFNKIERMSNVMDFGTCVANVNACFWNVFTNDLGFINEMIYMCLERIRLV